MRHLQYFAAAIVLLFPGALFAGQVYGTVTMGGRAVAKATFDINCNGNPNKGTTMADGSYRINVPQQGQCTFILPDYGGRPSAVVFSFPDPSHYDFELVAGPNQTYQLRKK